MTMGKLSVNVFLYDRSSPVWGISRIPPGFGPTYFFKSILGDFSLSWFCNNVSSIAVYVKPLTQWYF